MSSPASSEASKEASGERKQSITILKVHSEEHGEFHVPVAQGQPPPEVLIYFLFLVQSSILDAYLTVECLSETIAEWVLSLKQCESVRSKILIRSNQKVEM